jgi:toxin HigB-1
MSRFRCKLTEVLHAGEFVAEFQGFEKVARRRVRMVYQAAQLGDLARFPGLRFEKLSGDRKGQYSVRINGQWRICFVWNERAEEIEIVDYH